MRWVRTNLARVACGWLVVRLAVFVSVPTVMCSSMAAGAMGVECTCNHEGGGMCPMHHTMPHASMASHSMPSSHTCACKPSADPAAVMTATLLGHAAVFAPIPFVVASERPSVATPGLTFLPIDSSFVPDSPPPRA
jgi:hypothetical protein